jgi:hypothetical protein
VTERVRYQLPGSNLGLDLMRVDRRNRGGQGGGGQAAAAPNSNSGSLIQRVQLTALSRRRCARIGELLGYIRDVEAEWTQDAVQRITTENATLKQRVRQLSTDNRTLDERLKVARSNLRFRRIADLGVRLTESANPT